MAQDALDYFLHGLGILFRMRRIYPPGSNQVHQSARHAHLKLAEWGRSVRIAFLGNDAIVEDRRMETIPMSYRALFQSLQQLGFESAHIEADADENDLAVWIGKVISKDRPPYQGPKIIALQPLSDPAFPVLARVHAQAPSASWLKAFQGVRSI